MATWRENPHPLVQSLYAPLYGGTDIDQLRCRWRDYRRVEGQRSVPDPVLDLACHFEPPIQLKVSPRTVHRVHDAYQASFRGPEPIDG